MSFVNTLAYRLWRDSDPVASEVAFLWAYHRLATTILIPGDLADTERENVDF